MKTKFQLVMGVLNKHVNHKESYLITLMFPDSKIQEHLTRKLQESCERFNGLMGGIFPFYRSLDLQYQRQFDQWIAGQISDYKADSHINPAAEAKSLVLEIQMAVERLNFLWEVEHDTLNPMLETCYPESLPDFNEFKLEVDNWSTSVIEKYKQLPEAE
jgi:hypothetical protein